MASIKCGKCRGNHATVEEVRWCHNVATPPEFTAPGEKMVVGSSSPAIYLNAPYARKDEVRARGARWDRDAKKWWITKEVQNLNPEYWAQYADSGKKPIGEGWYLKDGSIYKVVLSQHDNLYAMILVIDRSKKGNQIGKWVYTAGAISDLRPEHLMSVENQCEYGKLYGFCVRCGRRLTKEVSQNRGMGDICAGKAGI